MYKNNTRKNKTIHRGKHYAKNTNKRLVTTFVAAIIIIIGAMFPQFRTEINTLLDNSNQTQQEQRVDSSASSNSSGSADSGDYVTNTSDKAYEEVNNNEPEFASKELKKAKTSYKTFSDLDSLGRCGVAEASVGTDLLPTEKRGSIGMVKPTGWHTVRYDDLISDKYLYNRCHLIAHCLCGENANEKNLITGTRYMNVEGMLPFEEKILDYVKETGNHVLYRVRPAFEEDNLVASGVYMMAESVEDNGKGLSFNVYCPNIQPGIAINYATGDSKRA